MTCTICHQELVREIYIDKFPLYTCTTLQSSGCGVENHIKVADADVVAYFLDEEVASAPPFYPEEFSAAANAILRHAMNISQKDIDIDIAVDVFKFLVLRFS